MHPKLKDPQFRFILIKLLLSLFVAGVLGYTLYQFVQFVDVIKQISAKFHETPSYEYDYGSAEGTAYYGCVCADLPDDTVVCTKCIPARKSHVTPDTPEQIFQRSLSHLLVYTCPQSAVVVKKESSYCYQILHTVLQAVLYSQEEMLSCLVKSSAFHICLFYLYYFPYQYWHKLLERNSGLNAMKNK
jgi:hypothetical protein